MTFHACQSGKAIADDILSYLVKWQLQPELLCGQAYDGAGAMAGKTKGAARISEKYPRALFTHCVSHRLTLCVVKCCNILEISNVMDKADSVIRFFNNSPKRQLELEKWISDVLPTEEKRRKLKELCRTRWVERHQAFEVFIDPFIPTICCMEAITHAPSDNWNRDTRSDANSLLLAMSRFPFIVSLVLTQKVLSYTKRITVKLQGRYLFEPIQK